MTEPIAERMTAEPTTTEPPTASMVTEPLGPPSESAHRPLYPRLLRLRNVHPNAWQRALLGEGALALAVLLVLADLATSWTLIVLPLAVGLVVKAHDVLAGLLTKDDAPPDRSASA